jgi:hypothetical protein
MHTLRDVNKWKKYKLLAFLGITDELYFQKAIKRFNRSRIDLLIESISDYFRGQENQRKLIIVKSPNIGYVIPIYRHLHIILVEDI